MNSNKNKLLRLITQRETRDTRRTRVPKTCPVENRVQEKQTQFLQLHRRKKEKKIINGIYMAHSAFDWSCELSRHHKSILIALKMCKVGKNLTNKKIVAKINGMAGGRISQETADGQFINSQMKATDTQEPLNQLTHIHSQWWWVNDKQGKINELPKFNCRIPNKTPTPHLSAIPIVCQPTNVSLNSINASFHKLCN